MMGSEGTIYLICMERSLGGTGRASARHYVGWTNGVTVERRLEEHRNGTGAKILAYASDHGIAFDVVRTWKGDRHFERRLKKGGNFAVKCPNCRDAARARQRENQRAYLRRLRAKAEALDVEGSYPIEADDLAAFDDIPF